MPEFINLAKRKLLAKFFFLFAMIILFLALIILVMKGKKSYKD